MQLPELLQDLGYHGNPNFLVGNKLSLDPEHPHVYRRAQVDAKVGGCSLKGVYRLCGESFGESVQTVPIVYVCEAATKPEADEIHRRVWNQSIVPFLIVSGPRFVRLYSGFKYAKEHTDNGLLEDLPGLEQASSALRAFSAASIDEGNVWSEWGQEVSPDTRVDWRLLKNLQDLDEELKNSGVGDRNTSHALIGKFVYLRYLRDRQILSDRKLRGWQLDPKSVFSRNATLQAFNKLLDFVQEWLNGEIFPIPEGSRPIIREDHIQLLAATFYGDEPVGGQLSLFDAYDFSFIPIETLSIIYEQFLHAQSGTSGRGQGAYYTPLPIVSFIVEKLDQRKPLQTGTRIFDPSCGSGAFLVYAYRKLIEKHRARNGGARPKLTELRELLVRHIFGVDIDPDACSVAELSLILTLLDYAHPPDLSTTSFQLPVLRGRNIHKGDFFEESAPWFGGDGYDWVIGNPPWAETRAGAIKPQYARAHTWMVSNKSGRPTGGNQVAEAFAWRATDVLKEEGVVGLLIPAMTLFKHESLAFRRTFFDHNHLWSAANFSNLAERLFAGRSRVAAAAIFYSASSDPASVDAEHERVEVYSPLVANAVSHFTGKTKARRQTWNLVVDSSEIRDIPYNQIENGQSLSWKLAAWASEADRRLLESVERRFPSVGDLEQGGRITISEGLQLRTKDAKEPVEHHPELAGQLSLAMAKLRGLSHVYQFPNEAVPLLPESQTYCRRRGGTSRPLRVCRPPHIIVSVSRTFAVFSDQFIVVPPRQIGIAGDKGDEDFLKALSLFLSSGFVRYHQFLVSPQAGVKREIATLADLRKLPLPFAEARGSELRDWVDLHTRLITASSHPLSNRSDSPLRSLLSELDEMTNDALRLTKAQRERVHDFVHVKLELRDGKTGEAAVRRPSIEDTEAYAETLCSQLDAFLGDSPSMWHGLVVALGSSYGVVEIDLKRGKRPDQTVRVVNDSPSADSAVLSLPSQLLEQRSQWLYFQRNLRIYQGTKTYLFKPMQRFHWTRSQAVDDAGDIIAETLVSEPQ